VDRHQLDCGPDRRPFLELTGATDRPPRRIIARWPGHMVHLDV
jgi:hypothetical protein